MVAIIARRTRHRVCVIGAGFGGCATAITLARDGHHVTVLEAVREPGPVGAGIMLQPSGMLALERLGLLDDVLAHGEPCARLRCTTRGGRTLFDLPYALMHERLYGLGLSRGALFHALYGALAPAGVEVVLGVTVKAIDGDRVVAEDGARLGPFDLVVVADGARSRLRTSLGHAHRDDEYPWGAFWFMAKDEARDFRGELFQAVSGAHTMFGLLPTGTTPADPTPRVSLFASVRLDQVDRMRARGLQALAEDAVALEPRMARVFAQITDFDELLVASYRDVRLPRLDFGRVVYVGDAAHAMSPQLGQGSNLALLDALALGDAMRTHGELAHALPAYSRARRSQLAFYQWMTRLLTPFFQGDSRTLGVLRDVFMPIASRTPILRGQTVATMCGVKRGIVRPSLSVPPSLLAAPGRALAPRLEIP